MYIVYENVSIIGYCVCWVVGEQFVCIVVLKVCVDFGVVVSSVHDANASAFITCFDYNRLFLLQVTTGFLVWGANGA